jgi:hypothetical protein
LIRRHAEERKHVEASIAGGSKFQIYLARFRYYDPRVAQIDEMAARGVKLTDVRVKVPHADGHEEWLSLADLKDRLNAEKVRAVREVADAVDECERGFRPYQSVMNDFVTIATGGLSKLLPERVTRIDISDILAGYPLGGPEAFIPKLREQLLGGDRGHQLRTCRRTRLGQLWANSRLMHCSEPDRCQTVRSISAHRRPRASADALAPREREVLFDAISSDIATAIGSSSAKLDAPCGSPSCREARRRLQSCRYGT